jgi:hypothetical protein
LVEHHTFDKRTNYAEEGEPFSITWVLRNDSSCPIEEGARFVFTGGADFNHPGTIGLAEALPPNAETTLTATFQAPSQSGIYTSLWQVVDATGEPVGSPVAFAVAVTTEAIPTQPILLVPPTPAPTATPRIVVATNTPTSVPSPTSTAIPARIVVTPTNIPVLANPTATPEPPPTELPTATSQAPEPLDFNAFVQSCEYADTAWRCQLLIAPTGGSEGPYTITIYADGELTDEFPLIYRQAYTATAPRCDSWTYEVRVVDTVTQEERSKFLYLDPNSLPITDYLGGQCTLPE